MTKDVETYFTDGCGRCPFGGTPQCKVHTCQKEMAELRAYILDCNLTEESKWGVPVYTYNSNNILILSAFKEYCAISFFKGSLLADTDKILDKPGENTQVARLIKFTSLKQVMDLERVIKAYIFEAIEIEKAGLKIQYKKNTDLEIPAELASYFEEDPNLKAAFEALTPGRQKSYTLHIASAKQEKTRVARIEKSIPKIMSGKGFNEY